MAVAVDLGSTHPPVWNECCSRCSPETGDMSSSTPSIRISQHPRYHSPSNTPPLPPASPMAVPRAQEPVPPPLPPPTYIPEISAGHDPGWQWGNDPTRSDFGRPASVKPGSSLLGSVGRDFRPTVEERDIYTRGLNDARRGSSISTITMNRDSDMVDAHSDDDAVLSRRASNYRYVTPCPHEL